MRVPAHTRFTLFELTALLTLPAGVYSKVASGCHLVLTEQQQNLPSPELCTACSIISVEDADGITVAVLKHPEGKTFARVTSEQTASSSLRGTPGRVVIVDEHEPVVPRREPPHAAPAGEDRFQRGVDAMGYHLKQQFDFGGPIRKIEFMYGLYSRGADMIGVDGEFSLRCLAKAFLDAYQPQITISDQVRFGQGKTAMKNVLLKARRADGIRFLGDFCASEGDDQAAAWPDILNIEGTIDIDALAKAFWSVMKEGE